MSTERDIVDEIEELCLDDRAEPYRDGVQIEFVDVDVLRAAIAEIRRLRAANEELVGALKECADDLARRIDDDWPAATILGGGIAEAHAEAMAPVHRARALLEKVGS